MAAQSGNRRDLVDAILRWVELGRHSSKQPAIHPLAQFAGTFAGDPIFDEVKQQIFNKRSSNKNH